MRKIVAGLFASVDGVVEAPEKWTGPYFAPEVGQAVGSLLAESDTLLLGRRTYETFRDSFANGAGADPMAARMNMIPKVVVSDTLTSADWANTTILTGNVREAIAELKQQPGENIAVSGSATLVRWLLSEALLDELNLLVFPVVLGGGQRLFGTTEDRIPLELVHSEAFGTSVLHLSYRPA